MTHCFVGKILFTLLATGLLLTLLVDDAYSRLSGEANLSYIKYDSSDKVSAHSLTQRYSLLYEKKGVLFDGRLAKYSVAFGYDWVDFDTTINTNGSSANRHRSNGHFLYNGEITVDPKEIPFRLHAYSRDMNRNIFLRDETRIYENNNPSMLGNLDITTGISNGLHTETGATLVMGVKNGMTNGYNEVLRHFPLLMLDFRDIINQDLKSTSPVNNRYSRLAFVSLNKKDNWFHYRLLNYQDFIDPSNNYRESQFQLGTIDHILQRRWIDFANWLSVSVDGQLTQRMNSLISSNNSEFDLNLFGIARRKNWEARSFANFNRVKENYGRVTYRTTVPLFVDGTLSADTIWTPDSDIMSRGFFSSSRLIRMS